MKNNSKNISFLVIILLLLSLEGMCQMGWRNTADISKIPDRLMKKPELKAVGMHKQALKNGDFEVYVHELKYSSGLQCRILNDSIAIIIRKEQSVIYNAHQNIFYPKKDGEFCTNFWDDLYQVYCENDLSNSLKFLKFEVDKKYGLMDQDGNVIIEPKYGFISKVNGSRRIFRIYVDDDYSNSQDYIGDYNGQNMKSVPFDCRQPLNGYIRITNKDDKKEGICDLNGNIIIPMVHDKIIVVSEGVFVVGVGGYSYIINKNNEILLPKQDNLRRMDVFGNYEGVCGRGLIIAHFQNEDKYYAVSNGNLIIDKVINKSTESIAANESSQSREKIYTEESSSSVQVKREIKWNNGDWEQPGISDSQVYDSQIKIKGVLLLNGNFRSSYTVWIYHKKNEHAVKPYRVQDVFAYEYVRLDDAMAKAKQHITRMLNNLK